jgi:diaminohydroxyphosphoribosylaminopyrimidine deaminase / 5-amino-6-(5-phosphoribosylamino)uracil reductase
MATHTGDSKWITNPKARQFARALRGEYQAILVGINTVLHDDPHLGARNLKRKDPLRIVLDSNLRIPLGSKVLRDRNVLIVTTAHASKTKRASLTKLGTPLLVFKSKNIQLKKLLFLLKKREITSILVEGGGEVLGSFVSAGLADRVYAFYAPILVGGQGAVSIGGKGISKIRDALRFKHVSIKHFGDNFLLVSTRDELKNK